MEIANHGVDAPFVGAAGDESFQLIAIQRRRKN